MPTSRTCLSSSCHRQSRIQRVHRRADYQHKRLVKYYTFFGFDFVKEVGDNGLADLPDQVAWGGVGTRMDADVVRMLSKWTPTLRKKAARLRQASSSSAQASPGDSVSSDAAN